MLRPNQKEFTELSRKGNLVPVVREILADTETPVSLFQKLDDGETSFLFESVEGGEKWARWSFIGVGARATFCAKDGLIKWSKGSTQVVEPFSGDPLRFLRDRLREFKQVAISGEALPRFSGGAVGAIAWDWIRFVEDISSDNVDELNFPDAVFVIPETVVVYDNVKHRALLIREVEISPEDDPVEKYEEAVRGIDKLVLRVRTYASVSTSEGVSGRGIFEANEDEESYGKMVEKAKSYIREGDIFQAVLSQRFQTPLEVEPLLIYRHLRRVNPSPYLFFLRCDDSILIGSSPEILVRVENGRIDLRPIAGTRPRGNSTEEDLTLEKELLADPKERAEHLMLVDLGRNDVGRVAGVGSVHVTDYAGIERYSHVMHIVSNVEGKMREGLDWLDVLRSSFPAGTLSGAPKIRAIEIIDELENLRRGPYGGCVGYVDYSGNMDMAITIRTVLIKNGTVYLQAGGGVVADSKSKDEYEESCNKAKALMLALDLSREEIR